MFLHNTRRSVASANVINVSLMAGNYTGRVMVIRKCNYANISLKSSGMGLYGSRLYRITASQLKLTPVRELAAPVNYYSIDLPDPPLQLTRTVRCILLMRIRPASPLWTSFKIRFCQLHAAP